MDIIVQTTVADVHADDPKAVAAAVQQLLDRAALLDLSSLYSMGVDDHDIETVVASFAPDGTFVYGGAPVAGREALRAFYVGMMDRYSLTRHVPTMHVFAVDTETAAHGLVSGTAELVYQGTTMLAAYRYDDEYVKADGRWMFGRRELRFMFTVPWDGVGSALAGRERIAWPDAPAAPAELPEDLPTWETYH